MKKYLGSFVVLLAVVAVANAAGTNLVQNGDFEDTHGAAVGEFLPLAPSSNVINPWVVGGTGIAAVDVVGSLWEDVGGNNSLDLNGTRAGWVEQSLDTQTHSVYVLTFDLSGNSGRHDEHTEVDKAVRVSVIGSNGGSICQDFVFTPDNSFTEMMWEGRSWTFEAPDDVTTLRFESLCYNTNGCGPVIDNVNVTTSHAPVPGALLLGGLGTTLVGWIRGRRLSRS